MASFNPIIKTMLEFFDAIAPSSSMTLWENFQSMDSWMQVFWGCAIVGSAIFVVQMVLTLIGMDSSDMDVDFDGGDTMDLGGGISLFSIKNFVNFIVDFGWGMCLLKRHNVGTCLWHVSNALTIAACIETCRRHVPTL